MHAPLLRFVVFALAKSPVSLAVAAAPALVHAVVAVAAVLAALAPLAPVAPPSTPYRVDSKLLHHWPRSSSLLLPKDFE